ncbi:uncharacterized protein LOC135923446 [Gordionus sp. m RMFG-2023]|uniref:uncharacterized protein LOC135923446 n=1 Tax=Gordionus sp. m RMFG-2023 TaxID=3053472 RepID=UPI0031FD87CC
MSFDLILYKICNPFNIIILIIAIILFYKVYRKLKIRCKQKLNECTTVPIRQDLTLKQLREFDGNNGNPIYIAVNGKIFDVSQKKDYYGPQGPYGIFAGRDATRGLAKFNLSEITDNPPDLSDLTTMEMESIKEWELQFNEKYFCVGRLINESEDPSAFVASMISIEALTKANNKTLNNLVIQSGDNIIHDDDDKNYFESHFEPLFSAKTIPSVSKYFADAVYRSRNSSEDTKSLPDFKMTVADDVMDDDEEVPLYIKQDIEVIDQNLLYTNGQEEALPYNADNSIQNNNSKYLLRYRGAMSSFPKNDNHHHLHGDSNGYNFINENELDDHDYPNDPCKNNLPFTKNISNVLPHPKMVSFDIQDKKEL